MQDSQEMRLSGMSCAYGFLSYYFLYLLPIPFNPFPFNSFPPNHSLIIIPPVSFYSRIQNFKKDNRIMPQ